MLASSQVRSSDQGLSPNTQIRVNDVFTRFVQGTRDFGKSGILTPDQIDTFKANNHTGDPAIDEAVAQRITQNQQSAFMISFIAEAVGRVNAEAVGNDRGHP